MNSDRYNMNDTPESAEERECAKSAAYEREIERGDILRDEQRDRAMEQAMERDEVARRANPIQSELSRLRTENQRLRAFVASIVDANGPYPELNGKQIVRDAYATLNPVADILRSSLPKAAEPAPPVPESLARTLASHRPPRFFRETSTGMEWEFRNGKMTTDGEDSIFKSPAEILECLDVIEVDEFGNALEPSAGDIAAEKADQSRE